MLDTSDIKTFKAISNGALRGDTLPTRLKVFGWGDNETIDGIYRAGHKTSTQLSANQKRFGFERVAIDFNHCTVPGNDTNKALMAAGQPPLIFGYGRVNPIAGDGIYLEEITWTPLGVQHARNFEDLSPALKDDNREVTMVHSVALTPNGKVTGLQFFSALDNQPQPSNKMTEKYLSLATLAGLLSLKADADEASVTAALAARLKPAAELTALSALIKDGKVVVLDTVAAMDGRLAKLEEAGTKQIATLSATINGTVKTFSAEDLVGVLAKVDALAAKITASETGQRESAVDALVKTFSADGKVPKKADGTAFSAEELKRLDLGTLQILSANTPVTVALAARSLTGNTDTKAKSFRDANGKVDMAALLEAEVQSQN